MNDLPEYFWDDLLDYIEEDKVIPIIGRKLVTVLPPMTKSPLSSCGGAASGTPAGARRRFAAGLLSEPGGLPDPRAAARPQGGYLPAHPAVAEVHSLPAPAVPPGSRPDPPLQAVRERHLRLAGLADAINATRFWGNAKTEEIAYSPNDIQDLRSEKKSLDRPVVYHTS
jgi:hypothetical protein